MPHAISLGKIAHFNLLAHQKNPCWLSPEHKPSNVMACVELQKMLQEGELCRHTSPAIHVRTCQHLCCGAGMHLRGPPGLCVKERQTSWAPVGQ